MKQLILTGLAWTIFLISGSALASEPGQDPLALKAVELCNNGKYDQAIATLSEGLKKRPNDAFLLYLRGKAYTAKGQYGPALTDLNQAIRLNPQNGQAYFGRALVHVYQENYEEAVKDLETAHKYGYRDEDFLSLIKKKAEGKRKK
jgi:tetratricopeptide (TPR) repeat protein